MIFWGIVEIFWGISKFTLINSMISCGTRNNVLGNPAWGNSALIINLQFHIMFITVRASLINFLEDSVMYFSACCWTCSLCLDFNTTVGVNGL
jgi:hypothetical protein